MRMRYMTIALAALLPLQGMCESAADKPAHDRGGLLARARSEHAAGHRMEALADCQEVLAHWPQDGDARRLNVQLLSEMGASARALELASLLPAASDKAAHARLAVDKAAHEIRWANGEPVDPRRPYDEIDRAIADIGRLVEDPDVPRTVRDQARFDLLVALDQGGRTWQVLAVYASLKRMHVQLPPYAEWAVADALLQRHRPGEAAALYEDGIRRDPGPYDPDDTSPRIGLAYAYLESGQVKRALATMDALVANEPRWIHLQGVRNAIQNQRRVDADIAAITLRKYAGLVSDAHARLMVLSAEAPANVEIRRELGTAELARGWPRRAMETLEIASTYDQRDAGAALDDADARRALNDYASEQSDIEQAEQLAGRSGRVEDAAQAWQRERGWQFDLSHDNGHGNSPDYGDHDDETLATLASPLIDDHWRVLALARLASASLPDGSVSRDRFGLGMRGYAYGLEFYVQALPAADRFVRRTAWETGVNWSVSDHWSLVADWSSAGAGVPLRAEYYGISAKTLDTTLQWRASELTSASVALHQDRFSDGNLRDGWLASLIQRLHSAAGFSLDGGLEIGGSHNSETDRPYFNPVQDHSYAMTGSMQNTLGQYSDRNWTERLDVAVGRYAELGFATGWMASVGYGQTFQPRAGLDFGWNLSWHNQPYDGRRESRVMLKLTMHRGE